MPVTPLIRRLKSHSALSERDEAALRDIVHKEAEVKRGQYIARERTPHNACYVLMSGLAISHKINGEGGRQIIGIFFPGEILNLEGLFIEISDQNIQALRSAQLASFECGQLMDLMGSNPAIGHALLREVLLKSVIARRWLAGRGVDTATRIAHLLCEVGVRLEGCTETPRDHYELPLTQEQLAEIVGVTALHAGRVLRMLEEDGLLRRTGRVIEILDWARLASRADFQEDYLGGALPHD